MTNSDNDAKCLLPQQVMSPASLENDLMIYPLRKPIPQSNQPRPEQKAERMTVRRYGNSRESPSPEGLYS